MVTIQSALVRRARLLGLLLLAVVLAACGTTVPPSVTSVKIDQGSKTLVVGQTLTLTATVKVLGGAATTVTWKSSAAAVASVDKNGKVTALKPGTAKITATSTVDKTKTNTVTITVTAPEAVTGVTIDQGDQSLQTGGTVSLTATVAATGGAPTTVTWSSGDTSVATVDTSGMVTAVAQGTATITATSTFDNTKSDSITVTVAPPSVTSVTIDQGNKSVLVGGNVQLTATVAALGGADLSVTWSSDDTSIATVDASGLVTGVAAGQAHITATSNFDNTKSDTVTLTVATAPSITSVTINEGNQAINQGATVQLTVTVNAAGGADPSVTWSSDDTSIATVDGTGLVTAVAGGTAHITATSNFDNSKSSQVTVDVTPKAVTGVAIPEGDQSINVGATYQFSANVTATGGADPSVTWSSSDTSVASVDAAGLVSGVAGGTATIKATSNFDNSQSASVTVTVVAPAVTSVTIDQPNQTLTAPTTAQLTATVDAVGGADASVNWGTSDTNVATVNSSGLVTTVCAGTATITATSNFDNTKTSQITVTVDYPAADPANINVDANATCAGNGSSAFPFQTITAGVSAVNASGTVNVASGSYNEALYFTKALDLVGAGEGSTTITTSADANGNAAIEVNNVDGLTLSGFTLDVGATPGPTLAAVGVYGGSSNFTMQNVTINESSTGNQTGLYLTNLTTATIDNVTVTDTTGTSAGAGVYLTGGSSGVSFDYLTTSGYSGYAGFTLVPGAGTLSNITITHATFNELDQLQAEMGGGGTVTGLDAPQFTYVVRNASSNWGANQIYFYKPTESKAILDSLYNFGTDYAQSYIQQLDGTDQAILLNNFVVGAAWGSPYQYYLTRVNSIQTAIDHAAPGATINVRSSSANGSATTFDEALDVNVAGLTISGAGSSQSKVTAPTGPVITVDANNVTITGLDINTDSPDATNAAVLVNNFTGFTINTSNFRSVIGLDDSAFSVAVDATGNWWNSTDGPGGDGTGTGSQLIDPTQSTATPAVTWDPFANTAQ